MPQNFFVTGMPKSGKTTIIRKVVEELKKRGLRVGGFISPEETEHGTRKGFHVQDIETGKVATLASMDADGPRVSKYHVDIKSFESIAVPSMENVDVYDVFVVDEIGRMELKSRKFLDLLDKVFESPIPVIASLHRDYVERYGVQGEVMILTLTNREAVFLDLIKKTTDAYILKKPRKAKPGKKAAKPKPKRAGRKKARKKARPRKKAKPAKRARPKEKKEKPAPAKEEKKEKPEEEKPKKRRGIVHSVRDLIGF